jgi:hypothetical protein
LGPGKFYPFTHCFANLLFSLFPNLPKRLSLMFAVAVVSLTRRPKTIIRDGQIKALVENYIAHPAAQRTRAAMADALALIQFHLSA